MSALPTLSTTPDRDAYDVVIIGGAMIGSSIAWHLSDNPDFDGRVLVVERDPTYKTSSTAHTNSCIRQQFSNEINVKVSQYGVKFIKDFRNRLGGDPEIPEIVLHSYGYMYLASSQKFADVLTENQAVQAACGAGTRLMTPDQIAAEYPFYNLDDIVLASHNPVDEGYFDGNTMFDWWRRSARRNGVEYVTNEVVSIERCGAAIKSVTLASGEKIFAGQVVNASGPRAARTAAMAGISLPVEPRKRYTFVFDPERPLAQVLPLTIDPAGVHFRADGQYYLAGAAEDGPDLAVDYDDFDEDFSLWEEKVWPAIANRVPQFEALKLIQSWVGHYAYNTLDQNAVLGAHPEVGNFLFANGFSGHGFQQSPAMGRGMSELIIYGGFRTLDLTPFEYARILRNEPFVEKAVI